MDTNLTEICLQHQFTNMFLHTLYHLEVGFFIAAQKLHFDFKETNTY